MLTIRALMRRPIRRLPVLTVVMPVIVGLIVLANLPWWEAIPICVWLVVASVAIRIARMWTIKCPVCKTMLGAKGRAVLSYKPSLDTCPHCGVNFDQPIESISSPK
jgi:hypothetical protein